MYSACAQLSSVPLDFRSGSVEERVRIDFCIPVERMHNADVTILQETVLLNVIVVKTVSLGGRNGDGGGGRFTR